MRRRTHGKPVCRRRRRLAPAARRSELIAAAVQVLRAKGPAAARVEDVTRAAGAAKGTFYLYFASWEEMLVAVREHLLTENIAAIRARFAAAGPAGWWAALEWACRGFVDFVVEMRELHTAIFHGPIAHHPMAAHCSSDKLIAELLHDGIAAGVCRPVNADEAAPLLFAALHAAADGVAREGGRTAKIETFLEMLRAWLRPPTAKAPSREVM